MKINKIILDGNFSSQAEVFQFLGDEMETLGFVENREDYLAAVKFRESQGTTGLIDGFAIPHGKSNLIKDAGIIYIRNQYGLDWESLDGSLVTDIFALAIPEAATGEHLNNLVEISRRLMDPLVCQQLREAQQELEIMSIFE